MFDGEKFGKDIVAAVKASQELLLARVEALEAALEQRDEQIADLRREVAEVRGRGFKFLGAYQRSQTYEIASCVQFDGHMWVCIQDCGVNVQPGQSDNWQLAVRRGRDAHERVARANDARDAR